MMRKMAQKTLGALLLLWLVMAAAPLIAAAPPVTIEDDAGQNLIFTAPPQRVVSLVPSATEIIEAIGAAANVAGLTYHDTNLPGLAGKPVVGGAFTPHFDRVAAQKPDLLIVAPRDLEKTRAALAERGLAQCPILVWDAGGSLAQAEAKIGWLGDIFAKQTEARKVVADNQALLETVSLKTAKLPDRLRVMRVVKSEGGLLTPGRDSFQTELILAAGGLPPDMGAGAFVPVSLEVWGKFNPQALYACGPDKKELLEFLDQPGWREAEAVKTGQIFHFPCALTCRAAAHTGYFAAWLSSMLYTDHFAQHLARPNGVLGERPLALDIPHVAQARLVESRLMDFTHRTLLIDFKRPQRVVSTVGGQRSGIKTVGNSFSPPPVWSVYHQIGFEKSHQALLSVLGLDRDASDILSTGADMNNLAVKSAGFEDLTVTALVTAGVESNALRAAKDPGAYYEKPGTINIIVLANRRLTDRAAARALITVTEAKTTALWDMDIRSAQSRRNNPATGTGTDDIIVVQGDEGAPMDYSGGHAKLGQLISETVHAGVQEAILKQNGKLPQRSLFERLAERGLSPYSLKGGVDPCQGNTSPCQRGKRPPESCQYGFEKLHLTPRYAGFVEAALAVSDASLMGQAGDLAAFETLALAVAGEIAGRPVEGIEDITGPMDLPEPLRTALNALGTGLKHLGE
jgi:adenosylcobinamide amidohydrolase/ABC-type Fe3+-hydroxamate transport system substrate-binding protein